MIDSCTDVYKCVLPFRVREAKNEGLDVVDVDGPYVYRKYEQIVSSGIAASDPGPPTLLLTG